MKKIKVLGERVISKLLTVYKSGRISSNINPLHKCPENKNWLEIDSKSAPIYFFRNWNERKTPNESGAAFIFHDNKNINLVAIMEDSDVFSNASLQNDRTWEKGDVLEFFIQPSGNSKYYELHVAPNLATLQLSIPDVEKLRKNEYKFEELIFDSESEFGADIISTDDFKGWWGLISIPAPKNGINISKDSSAKFAVCRYNYWKNREKPECSSTAPLSKLSFHRPEEWQTLSFQ